LISLPILEIVAPLGLSRPVVDALCAGSGRLGALLHLAECSETGDLGTLTASLRELPELSLKSLNRAQTQALQWANAIGKEEAC
jgi:EAL and modified HD-GYP domain-containing signal transduction protein